MNRPPLKLTRGGGVRGAALIVASLWCAVVRAQSPVGSWDCLLSQGKEGVAQVWFADDGSLGGIAVYTPSGLGGSHTNHGVTRTNFFGSARLNGQWTFDGPAEDGRITGYINFVSPALSLAVKATHGFSFHGKAQGEKLTFDAKGYG